MEEVATLVRNFEEQRLALEDWDHISHLVVCCWLVMRDPNNAEERLRNGIVRLNRSLGVISTATSGYHETLTLFWLAKVRCLVDVCSGTDIAVLRAVVEGLADKNLVYFHYSPECIANEEARQRWVEPDLCHLPVDDVTLWHMPERALG